MDSLCEHVHQRRSWMSASGTSPFTRRVTSAIPAGLLGPDQLIRTCVVWMTRNRVARWIARLTRVDAFVSQTFDVDQRPIEGRLNAGLRVRDSHFRWAGTFKRPLERHDRLVHRAVKATRVEYREE